MLVASGSATAWALDDEVVPTPQLQTAAEKSNFTQTSTYDEVIAFVRALDASSDLVRVESLGESVEGRDIPVMFIGDPPLTSPEDASKAKKPLVLLFGNIHAGEVCGKEALLMLARDLVNAEEQPLLEKINLAIIPIYNVDGNERFAPDNRPGQDGPEQMGIRRNAMDLDLNRDWVKLDAPESRAMVRFFYRYDPAVIVDTHTTNGSHHQYTITYQGPKHPAGDPEIIEFVRDTMLPAVSESFEEATGYKSFFYGNFASQHTKWTTYPALPRYGVAYRGLRNRLSILSEAYAYAPFEDRVLGTQGFCDAVLQYAADNASKIRQLVTDADTRTTELGDNTDDAEDDLIAVKIKPEAFEKKVEVLGYEETREDGEHVVGDPTTYEVELINNFVPVATVVRPWAYIIPPSLGEVATQLQRHGVKVDICREDAEVSADVYRIDAFAFSSRKFEGHGMVRGVKAQAIPRSVRVDAGAYIVKTAQPLGTLACYLLEPESEDGLVAWNFFDDHLVEGADFPVVRLREPTALTSRRARPLERDREYGKRVDFEAVYESRRRPSFTGSPVRGLRWLDDEYYAQSKNGKTYRVHALSGRVESMTFEDHSTTVAERLAEIPTLDSDAAKQIARRYFGRGDDPKRGVVFTHANDLYYANGDGTHAVRLTSTPEAEEYSELSPDGEFVAFCRNNDLWVVDVATQTERALTTGGRDDFRHGKASWVYFEEVFGRRWKAFWWSPDSSALAFFQTDSVSVPHFTIIDDNPEEQNIETVRYPKPGQRNPHVEVGLVHRTGGAPRWVDLSDYDDGAYLVTHVGWTPDSSNLRLQIQDRAQTWLDYIHVDRNSRKPEVLFRETTEAWVQALGNPHDFKDGSFLLRSERDGWRHIYHFNADGSVKTQVTSGDYEVRTIHRVDENTEWIYFSGTVDSHIASNLYRVRFDGTELTRLTLESGSHQAQLNAKGDLFIDSWSSHAEPTRVALRSIEGEHIRWIDTNPVYEKEEYALGTFELVEIESDHGPMLQASVLYPPDFDESKSYPAWFMTYGGPHAPTVRDSGGGPRMRDYMLADMGIVVFRGDPHPASGKGAQSAWTAYKQLGVREMEDITDMIEWLKTHEWIDGDRIGMAGHSYGGFMTAFALTHSDLFASGIAGAPVTDWRLYDSIYTERYMHTPQNNPDGYRNTSVVNAAKNLHGRLLVVHGTMDDNVHQQNSIRLIAALQRAGKPFEMFLYPGYRHGIFGNHYRDLQLDFITRTLLDSAPDAPETPYPGTDEVEPSREDRVIIGPGNDTERE